MGALATDLIRVYTRRLVAVMPVRDQKLGLAKRGRDRLVDGGIGDPPNTVDRALAVGDLAPRIAEMRLDAAPHGAGMEREDRRQVVPGRPRQAQAILLGTRLRALVRADAAGAVVGDAHPRKEAMPGPPASVGGRVVLRERPDRGFAIGHQDAVEGPRLERLRGVFVGVAATRGFGKVDLNHVERGSLQELGALLGVDDVVGRRRHVGERRDRHQVVVKRAERLDLGHGPANPTDVVGAETSGARTGAAGEGAIRYTFPRGEETRSARACHSKAEWQALPGRRWAMSAARGAAGWRRLRAPPSSSSRWCGLRERPEPRRALSRRSRSPPGT